MTGTFNAPGWVYYNVTADVAGDYLTQDHIGWCLKQTPPVPWVWINFYTRHQVPMPDYRPMLEITYAGPVAAERGSWGQVKALFR